MSWRVRGGLLMYRFRAGQLEVFWPIRSNLVSVEYPPNSGKFVEFPEFDEARFSSLEVARPWLRKSQRPLLDRLPVALGLAPPPVVE